MPSDRRWVGSSIRSAVVLVFTASFGLFAASWVWRRSSPLDLTDTRNRRKVEYLLLPTCTALFRLIGAGLDGGSTPHWPR